MLVYLDKFLNQAVSTVLYATKHIINNLILVVTGPNREEKTIKLQQYLIFKRLLVLLFYWFGYIYGKQSQPCGCKHVDCRT